MKEYHKIQSVFKRDPKNNHKTFLMGDYSIPEFEYLAHNVWQFTEKVNGTNIRVIYNPYPLIEGVTFQGKTDQAQIPATLYKVLSEMFTLDKFKTVFPFTDIEEEKLPTVTLYGEGYGARIQKSGGNYRTDQSFVLFDIKIGNWWLQRKDLEDLAKQLEIDIVPIIGEGTLYDMVEKCEQGFKSQWGDFIAEGIVARPEIELFTRSGHRIITKIKYKDFR